MDTETVIATLIITKILFVQCGMLTCVSVCICVCVFECLCVTCANEYTKGSPKKPCFLVLLFSFQYRLTTNWFHSIVSWRVKI